jgi:hypothetical protein
MKKNILLLMILFISSFTITFADELLDERKQATSALLEIQNGNNYKNTIDSVLE